MQLRVVQSIRSTSSLYAGRLQKSGIAQGAISRLTHSKERIATQTERGFSVKIQFPIIQKSIQDIIDQTKEKKEKEIERKLENFWQKKQDDIFPFLKKLTKGKFKPGGHCNVYNLVLALEIKRERIGDTVSLVMSMEEREGILFSRFSARMHSFVLISNRIIADIAHSPYSGIKDEGYLLVGKEEAVLRQVKAVFKREYTFNVEDTKTLKEVDAYAKKEKGYSELTLSDPRKGSYIPEKTLIKITERFYGVKVKKDSWLTWLLGKHITKTETWQRIWFGEESLKR